MSGDEYPTYGDFCDEEAAEEERGKLLRPVHAFSNGSHYLNWSENNCKQCKWSYEATHQHPCPIQRVLDRALFGDGMVYPWVMHVAGIDDNKGECRVKEAK